jgi:hypothetical protein
LKKSPTVYLHVWPLRDTGSHSRARKDARKDASARRGEQAYSVRKAAVDWDDGETRASTPNKKSPNDPRGSFGLHCHATKRHCFVTFAEVSASSRTNLQREHL